MQENDFEKTLQQKMELLQLQPADALWQKIQVQVAKKNQRKRRVIFFFLLCLSLTAVLLLLTNKTGMLNYDQSIAAAKAGNKTTQAAQTIEKDKKETGLASATQPVQPGNEMAGSTDHLENNITVTASTKNGSNIDAVLSTGSPDNKLYKQPRIKGKKKGALKSTITNAAVGEGENENENATVAITGAEETTIGSQEQPALNKNDVAESKIETKQEEVILKVTVKKDSVKTVVKDVATVKNATEKNKQKLWGVGLSFSAGRFQAGNSYNNNKSLAADYTNNAGSPGAGAGTITLPSQTKPGIGLSAGIRVFRSISAKSKIIAGVQYQFFTTSVKTGSRFDSGILSSAAFRSGNTKSFTNRYHLISIPLSFSTTIFTIGKKEISLDAGINFSRLIQTNSLQFNLGNGVYYTDNNLFNKNIVGLSAAAVINLSSKNKSAFYIGPEFYYSITPMATAGLYAKSHYSFAGIRLQKNLTK